MKNISIKTILFVLGLTVAFASCKETRTDDLLHDIQIGVSDNIETLNQGELLSVPLTLVCDAGFQSAFYKTVTLGKDSLSNKVISSAIAITVPETGNKLETTLNITVPSKFYGLVISVTDKNKRVHAKTVTVASTKERPVLAFKDNVKFRKTALAGANLSINGTVTSQHELTEVSLVPIVNGAAQAAQPVAISDKLSVNVSQAVQVKENMNAIVLSAKNSFGGLSTDTFKIGSVVTQDFIDVALTTGLVIGTDGKGVLSGSVASGSDVSALKLTLTTNGVAGNETAVTFTENSGNETKFAITIDQPIGLEKMKFVATNAGGKSNTVETGAPCGVIRGLKMSSDPAGGSCFLSLYETNKTFGITAAKAKQLRVDFFMSLYDANSISPLSPHAYGAGAQYYNVSKGYLAGFNQLTYQFITARRGKIASTKDEIETIKSEEDLTAYLNYRIIGPNPDGENYNIPKASRRVGNQFNPTHGNTGFLIGWGSHTHPTVSPAVVDNIAFAIIFVNKVTKQSNGHFEMEMDVWYPVSKDYRELSNPSAVAPYDPFPL